MVTKQQKSEAKLDLSSADLQELEKKEKTPLEKQLDKVICFLPFLMTIIHLLEYLYIPNYPGNQNTFTYVYFLGAFAIYYLIRGLLAMFNNKQFKRWRYKAPLQTLIFFLLMVYDILTLKTATLLLPYFPWVDQLINAILSDWSFLMESTTSSLSLLFQGFILGAIVGLLSGILCGYFEKTNYWISPFVTVIGSIPTTTWIPIVMVLAASLRNGALFVISLGVFFALHNASFAGVRSIDREYYEVAKTLGAEQRQLMTSITIPAILPNVFTGLIQGMSTACTSLIVAEMMGVESGLGFYITWQKNWAQYDKMYGGILVICIMFLAVHFVLKLIESHLLKWKDA
ncbi:ABC transporter permease [Aerococcus kribbianus]|uniref:ABC transporter permease subunit n=1 Tax=Aerococcus kribbianus TaxID=2999064 RepID=A0A9X3JG46_9LACT|nr:MULTISPECIES: ABC transporter permease subunit [unclassified Aerococcus]MCZ0716856.1 ABC transporter permease subunit [Aerococcus sp. YH-aer221]MCZ0725144.1 ABC transporter permease subunit [Aerococcus sp. YH-aer222]